MPMSASRASPGPLTTQPMTATLMGARMVCKRASTCSARLNRSMRVRPQVGQEISSGPRSRMRRERSSSQATRISSTGSRVSEMRKVSPMPSKRRMPRATLDLTVPAMSPPASVTPRCRG